MRSVAWIFAALLSLLWMPAMAADPPSRVDRLSVQAAAKFLDLTSEQVVRVQAARAEHQRRLGELAADAARAGSGRAAATTLATVCAQARESEAAFHGKVAALLSPPQVARLDQLSQAFQLMPLVESAQAAGLLPESLGVPPPGLPQGSAEVAVRWQRIPAKPLPGCADTTVLREVATGGDDAPRGGSVK